MVKTHAIIGTYNHLPEGTTDSVFEDTYQYSYRPFLSILNKFPEIQAVLHFSGPLLRRLELKHPEYLMLLEEMTARKQIELLGGAFYEPLLPLIPNSDRLGQIELLTTYLRKMFGKRPRGCWLHEYSWEPWLASTMVTCGIDYTFLTQEHFKRADIATAECMPVITEDQGRCVTVFPMYDCEQSFPVPMGLEKIFELHLKTNASQFSGAMMQGELLKHFWEKSQLESPDVYMEKTFAWFRKNLLVIETTLPTKYLKNQKLLPRAYFPGLASTRFMNASTLSANKPESESGSMRRAIIKFACSRSIYAKMSYVHILISQLRGDKSRKKTAMEDLWKGQCVDALWQSPSGGILHPSIRQTVWQSLLDAEQTTRLKNSFKPGIIRADIDFDGAKELLFQGVDINAYIHTHGAIVFELDVIKAKRNLCDIFIKKSDYSEAHSCLFADFLGLQNNDSNPSKSDKAVKPAQILNYSEVAVETKQISVVFKADSRLSNPLHETVPALIKKTFDFSRKNIKTSYEIQNASTARVEYHFTVEMNLAVSPEEINSLLVDSQPNVSLEQFLAEKSADRKASVEKSSKISVNGLNSGLSVSISSVQKMKTNISTLSTVSPEKLEVIQGLCLSLSWGIALDPDEVWHNELTLSLLD